MNVVISSYSPDNNAECATLVFETIRIGFPTAKIKCVCSALSSDVQKEVLTKCLQNKIQYIYANLVTNDVIGNETLATSDDITVLVDADVVFWEKVEDYNFTSLVAGRFIPRHRCKYLDLPTEARLHPSLLFLNPVELRKVLPKSPTRFGRYDWCTPQMIWKSGSPTFYDTFTNLYHSGIPTQYFNDSMLNKYDHLFCSTFVKDVATKIEGLDKVHEQCYKDISLMKGMWKMQEQYFNENRI